MNDGFNLFFICVYLWLNILYPPINLAIANAAPAAALPIKAV
jgi:hypothetical protein